MHLFALIFANLKPEVPRALLPIPVLKQVGITFWIFSFGNSNCSSIDAVVQLFARRTKSMRARRLIHARSVKHTTL